MFSIFFFSSVLLKFIPVCDWGSSVKRASLFFLFEQEEKKQRAAHGSTKNIRWYFNTIMASVNY
ncbi:MAG: hypothetical protein V4685_07110 [Bacteroidota bacterium]